MIDVIGEALVDLVIEQDGTVSAVLGGAPMNTARTCGRLGVPVRFLGTLSSDRFGRMLREQLVADGVADGSAAAVDLPTTLAAAEINAGGAARYRFYVEGTSAPRLELDSVPDQSGTTAVYTGGLALVLEPMAATVEAVLDRLALAASEGASKPLVMVDINSRPLLISDQQAYMERLARLLPNVDVVKASDEDLQFLFPTEELIDAAQEIRATGPKVVLVTAGGNAAHIVTADGVEVVEVPKATVVDTIGAGDSFSGGFLSWWIDRGLGVADLDSTESLVAATTAATRVAAIVVGRRGADPPWRTEVADDFT